jgi:hypothetical protein
MSSALENLTGPGKPLSREPFDAREFDGLVHSGRARLRDAANPANSIEGRFDLAYNAAHALSLAALRRAGYRASHCYIVLYSDSNRSIIRTRSRQPDSPRRRGLPRREHPAGDAAAFVS